MKKSKKQERIAALREQALALLRDGKHEGALANFATLEKLEPDQPDWSRRAADCHRALGDRAEQIEALGRAAERYTDQGAVPKALAMYRMILNLDPAHARTQNRLMELERGAAPVEAPEPPPRAKLEPPPKPQKKQAPPPENRDPPPAAVADTARARPTLEQVLRQRRAASPRRPAPAPEAALEERIEEREAIALPFAEPASPEPPAPEPPASEPPPLDLVAPEATPSEPAALDLVAPDVPAPVEIPAAIEVSAPVDVAAPVEAPALEQRAPEDDAEPEVVPDEIIIPSLPPGEALVAGAQHTPVPPSDEAVTLRPARPSPAPESDEPDVLPKLSATGADSRR